MKETLIKKQNNILNYILANNLIHTNHNTDKVSCHNTNTNTNINNIYLPDVIALSFPITSLIKQKSMVYDLLPNILNYSTTSDGFPNWYA